jgi:hypothetical protein
MQINPDDKTVELTQEEQYYLVMNHVITPEFDRVIDLLKTALPNASQGLAILALVLARCVDERYKTLIDSSLDYVVEYAVSAEFTLRTEATE